VDLPKLNQKLEALSARKTFEPLDVKADTDVRTFLKNERENAILSVIEDTKKNVSNEPYSQNIVDFSHTRRSATLRTSRGGPV